MAHRWRLMNKRRRKIRKRRRGRCQVPACKDRNVLECRINPWEKPSDWLCSEHAEKEGFCAGCGLFCAGIESFDFGRYPGFCDNCQDEIRSNEWDEFDHEWDESRDYDVEYWRNEAFHFEGAE